MPKTDMMLEHTVLALTTNDLPCHLAAPTGTKSDVTIKFQFYTVGDRKFNFRSVSTRPFIDSDAAPVHYHMKPPIIIHDNRDASMKFEASTTPTCCLQFDVSDSRISSALSRIFEGGQVSSEAI